jgi:hypothetical protein
MTVPEPASHEHHSNQSPTSRFQTGPKTIQVRSGADSAHCMMNPQAYFSLTPNPIHYPSVPQPCPQQASIEHSTFMRSLFNGWCESSTTPPASRTVSFSSWTRVTRPTAAAPLGELKASVICKGSGTTPSYDPPACEWIYLGAEQPLNYGKPTARARDYRRKKSYGSFATTSSMSNESDGTETEPITFSKQQPKRVSTESQLTSSFRSLSTLGTKGLATMAERLGLDSMTCEELPSAFDSDSEDNES